MASRYWVGGSGNWSDTAHWSNASGGTGGYSVPGVSDSAYFRDTSYPAGVSSTINIDIDVTCNSISFQRSLTEPQNIINLAGRTITVGRSLIFNHENFDLSGATINFGRIGVTINGLLIFYNTGSPIYDTENLTINVIKRNNTYNSSIYFYQDEMVIPNMFVDFSNDLGISTFNLIIQEENCNIHIGTLSNNVKEDLIAYVYICAKANSSFHFTNFNFSGSLEDNFQISFNGDDYSGDFVSPVHLIQTSGSVSVERLSLYNIISSGGATWVNKYSIYFEYETVSGWTYFSPLYWIGGSGDILLPENWSLTSGGSSSTHHPFKYVTDSGDPVVYSDDTIFDLIFDENSFTENDSLVSFYITDIMYGLTDGNYSCKSIISTNATKTFTLKYTNESNLKTCNISIFDLLLNNKITICGNILDWEDYTTACCIMFSLRLRFFQNGATLGPQFLLGMYESSSYGNLQLESDIILGEFSGIYIRQVTNFDSNGYDITSPIYIFGYYGGGS